MDINLFIKDRRSDMKNASPTKKSFMTLTVLFTLIVLFLRTELTGNYRGVESAWTQVVIRRYPSMSNRYTQTTDCMLRD